MRGASVTTQDVMGAVTAASKQGVPFEDAIAKFVGDREQQRHWEQSGLFGKNVANVQQLQAANERAQSEGAAQADTYKALAAYVTLDPGGKAAWARFQENPSIDKARQLFDAARQSPTFQMRQGSSADVLNAVPGTTMGDTLSAGENFQLARYNPGMESVLSNPAAYKEFLVDPTRVSAKTDAMLAQLSPKTRQTLMNPAVRASLLRQVAGQELAGEQAQPLPQPRPQPPQPAPPPAPQPAQAAG
jgi:hypothetical protein